MQCSSISQVSTVEELDRVVHPVKVLDNGESHLVKTIEVDGFWKDEDGVYHMMECRRYMSLVFSVEFLVLNCFLQAVVEQRKRTRRVADFLDISDAKVQVYICCGQGWKSVEPGLGIASDPN
jgi:hypothetical protein